MGFLQSHGKGKGGVVAFWDLPTLDVDIWLCIVRGDGPSGRGSKFTLMLMHWGEAMLHLLFLRAYQLSFILIPETVIWICCNKAFCQIFFFFSFPLAVW